MIIGGMMRSGIGMIMRKRARQANFPSRDISRPPLTESCRMIMCFFNPTDLCRHWISLELCRSLFAFRTRVTRACFLYVPHHLAVEGAHGHRLRAGSSIERYYSISTFMAHPLRYFHFTMPWCSACQKYYSIVKRKLGLFWCKL